MIHDTLHDMLHIDNISSPSYLICFVNFPIDCIIFVTNIGGVAILSLRIQYGDNVGAAGTEGGMSDGSVIERMSGGDVGMFDDGDGVGADEARDIAGLEGGKS